MIKDRVTACIDGGHCTAAVCDYAVWAARRLDQGMAFAVLATAPPPAIAGAAFGDDGSRIAQLSTLSALAQLDERRTALIEQYAAELARAASDYVGPSAALSSALPLCVGPLEQVLAGAGQQASLLVLGWNQLREHPWTSRTRAPDRSGLAASCVSLLIVPGRVRREPRNVVLAFDSALAAHSMIEKLKSMPLLRGLHPSLLLSAPDTVAGRQQASLLADALQQADIATEPRLDGREFSDALADLVAETNPDLLVVGGLGFSKLQTAVNDVWKPVDTPGFATLVVL